MSLTHLSARSLSNCSRSSSPLDGVIKRGIKNCPHGTWIVAASCAWVACSPCSWIPAGIKLNCDELPVEEDVCVPADAAAAVDSNWLRAAGDDDIKDSARAFPLFDIAERILWILILAWLAVLPPVVPLLLFPPAGLRLIFVIRFSIACRSIWSCICSCCNWRREPPANVFCNSAKRSTDSRSAGSWFDDGLKLGFDRRADRTPPGPTAAREILRTPPCRIADGSFMNSKVDPLPPPPRWCSRVRCSARSSVFKLGSPPGDAAHTGQITSIAPSDDSESN